MASGCWLENRCVHCWAVLEFWAFCLYFSIAIMFEVCDILYLMLCSYSSVANLFESCTCIVIEVRVEGKHPVEQLSYHSGAHHIPTTFTAWITYSASVSIHILTVHISVSLTQCIMCILPCSIAPIAKPTPPSFVARAEGKLLLPFVAPLVTKRKGRLPGTGHVFSAKR